MKIDPSDKRWDDRPRRPSHAANLDPAALAALVLEIGTLGELAGWPPIGELVESLRETAAGSGGLTRHETDRLRYWARRWRELPSQTRRFYREALRTISWGIEHGTDRALEQRAISKALWHVFEGYELPSWAYGLTLRLFDELEGGQPDYELIPRGRRSPTATPQKRI
jgi:hypothetical protein